MKKFLAMLVAAMMVLSLVAIPVFADGEVVFAVENAPATATPGTEITVNLTVNGTFEAHVLNMQFNYNADAFEYVSHTRGDVLNQIIDLGGTQLVDATTIPGSMRLGVMMPTAAFTQSGTICSVTLRVKEGAANGASDLALVITEFKNFPTGGQATPIANVVNNATVTITGGSEPTPVPPTEEPTPTQNPNTPAPGGMATISLTAGDVFSDGSGYQMLLDADATAFGNEIPAEGPLTQSGNAPAGLYDAFEYKIPVNADGSTTTSNIVINNTVTIEVPAGTYDWCITNPTPGDRIWIASAQGNIGGRADDYEFEAGYTYNFTVYLLGQNDATDVEIIPGGEPPVPPTDAPITDAPITDAPITDAPITDAPITDEPITDEPITDEPITDEPITDEPITDEPGTDEPITDEPGVTDEPTAVPTDAPNPPITGAMSLIGVGIAAIVASAGVVIFRKKEED